jgi:hypothetical protein
MATLPKPGDATGAVAYALEQIVVVRDAIADGDLDFADAAAERIELDLRALRQQLETESRAT